MTLDNGNAKSSFGERIGVSEANDACANNYRIGLHLSHKSESTGAEFVTRRGTTRKC